MTRKDLLAARANDVMEVALSKGVCLSEAECLIVREAVLVELVRVEREVWVKVMDQIRDGREDKVGLWHWARAQQQELT